MAGTRFFRKQWYASWLEAAAALLFPSSCLGCGCRLPSSRPPLFCATCLDTVPFIDSPLCPCCGLPLAGRDSHLCATCLQGGFSFARARSAVRYTEHVAPLIRSLKFRGRLEVLATLAAITRHSAAYRELAPPEVIIPVPLHEQRLRSRGFNQALLLCRALFPEEREKIAVTSLVRCRNTSAQTHLSREGRIRNVKNAFAVKKPEIVQSRRILLVDDVFTTGSTAHECAAKLLQSGAAAVEVLTVARAI